MSHLTFSCHQSTSAGEILNFKKEYLHKKPKQQKKSRHPSLNRTTQGFQITGCHFLVAMSFQKGRGDYSTPQLKSCLQDWGPCEHQCLTATTGLELFQEGNKNFILCCQLDSQQLRPPQVFHAALILTHCGTQKPFQNIMQRGEAHSPLPVTCKMHLLYLYIASSSSVSDGSVSHLYQAMPSIPDHQGVCLHDSSTSIILTQTDHTTWLPLQEHQHFSKASPGLCLSRSFSNIQQSSLIHVLQLNPAPLSATHQLHVQAPVEQLLHHAPILHFIQGAKYLGIASCESYYIYYNITKLERFSVPHS